MIKLTLSILADTFAVCRLDPGARIPDWATAGGFFSITRTADELSIVCQQRHVPEGILCEKNWRALMVGGPLDFGLVGILNTLSAPLARAEISIFALSTYDTDYLLIREKDFENAITVLSAEGHTIKK